MKLFVYSMREYDELAFFEKFCGEYGVEFGYTTQTPCHESGFCKYGICQNRKNN